MYSKGVASRRQIVPTPRQFGLGGIGETASVQKRGLIRRAELEPIHRKFNQG